MSGDVARLGLHPDAFPDPTAFYHLFDRNAMYIWRALLRISAQQHPQNFPEENHFVVPVEREPEPETGSARARAVDRLRAGVDRRRRGPSGHQVSDEPMPAERSTSDDCPMIAETYLELFAAWGKSDYIPDAPEGDEPTWLQKLGFWIVIAGSPLVIVSITAQSIRIGGEYPAIDVVNSLIALLAILIALMLVLPPLADRLFGIRRVVAIEQTDGGAQTNG